MDLEVHPLGKQWESMPSLPTAELGLDNWSVARWSLLEMFLLLHQM